jgi:pilus assembly protein CpaF
MLYLEVVSGEGSKVSKQINATKCVVGRDQNADVVLPGWKVHKLHAEFFVSNESVFIRDLGSMFGTYVRENKITTYGPLKPTDQIIIGPHQLRAKWQRAGTSNSIASPSTIVHEAKDAVAIATAREHHVNQAPVATTQIPALQSVPQQQSPISQPSLNAAPSIPTGIDQENLRLRKLIQEKLIEAFDMRRTDVHRMADKELRIQTEKAIREILAKLPDLPANIDRNKLIQEVSDEAVGLGLLEPLLADHTITEIMVNKVDEIFVERAGRLQRLPMAFTSEKAVMGIIERIVAPVGRRVDESSPLVDARLKDGSRFNAVIPPLALKGPSMTIRKFSKRKLEAADLMKFGSANKEMVEFLQVAVEQRKNVIVSGGTGSGKTTLLNILSNFIPKGERIVTIEDAAELQLYHDHLVSLESRPANSEGKGQVAIRDLVRNSLRMRPDRIVVGECRGGEALDMLQAMNTGHDGSLTTAHANSPRDMLARLEVMVLMAGMDLPVTAIREQVASAVDIIVQQTRFACGSRKITKITEVTGVESGKIQLQDLFTFIETGYDADRRTAGYFTGCDFVPEFYEKLRAIGVDVNLDIFAKKNV